MVLLSSFFLPNFFCRHPKKIAEVLAGAEVRKMKNLRFFEISEHFLKILIPKILPGFSVCWDIEKLGLSARKRGRAIAKGSAVECSGGF